MALVIRRSSSRICCLSIAIAITLYNSAFVASGPSDNSAPSIPANLVVLSATNTTVNLDWANSTDNVGVTGYDVYVDGVKKHTVAGSAATADGLIPTTSIPLRLRHLMLPATSPLSAAQSSGATTNHQQS